MPNAKHYPSSVTIRANSLNNTLCACYCLHNKINNTHVIRPVYNILDTTNDIITKIEGKVDLLRNLQMNMERNYPIEISDSNIQQRKGILPRKLQEICS